MTDDQRATLDELESTSQRSVGPVEGSAHVTRSDAGAGRDLGAAALKGALAAVAGGLVLKALWEGSGRLLPAGQQLGSPTRGAVDAFAARRGARLTERQRAAGAAVVYTGAMATWGALYGIVQSRLHPPALATGLALGALVYATNFSRAAPLTKRGIAPAFGTQRGAQRAASLGSHAAFGLATAAAFEALA